MDAQRQDTLARRDFGQWIVEHIDRWLAFARRLGLGIVQMEEIVLVTGCHRSRSWANVAFLENHTNAQVSFGVKVVRDPVISIKWQLSPWPVQEAVSNFGPEGEVCLFATSETMFATIFYQNLPEDQCIFVRGFRVARPLAMLPRRRTGTVGPNQARDWDHEDNKLPMEPTPLPTSTMVMYSDRHFMTSINLSQYRDPLHVLLEYIAKVSRGTGAMSLLSVSPM